VLSALLSALFSALFFAFTVWRIVVRGENPVGPGTSVSGGVRTRSVYALKLSWPSTAEYRMMKLKKKNCRVCVERSKRRKLGRVHIFDTITRMTHDEPGPRPTGEEGDRSPARAGGCHRDRNSLGAGSASLRCVISLVHYQCVLSVDRWGRGLRGGTTDRSRCEYD